MSKLQIKDKQTIAHGIRTAMIIASVVMTVVSACLIFISTIPVIAGLLSLLITLLCNISFSVSNYAYMQYSYQILKQDGGVCAAHATDTPLEKDINKERSSIAVSKRTHRVQHSAKTEKQELKTARENENENQR